VQSANAASTGLRHYAVVTSAYWGFTLTDGALRMLVLLHFYRLGYSPFTLAFLFLLYEFAGIIANLIGGWLATRFGITRMLTVGLITQICGFLLLSALSPDWSVALSVAWVVLAQGVCGVAKDLTKTASKSAIKITSGEASGRLFHWVAWFTGSKNAMKGIGFFLGGFMLDQMGFRGALWSMAGLLGLILIGVVASLPPMIGKSRASRSVRELFSKSRPINLLAAARIGLFGARDVWFVVGVPVFLYASGWTFTMVGGFLAAWTIAYGAVQAIAPQLVKRSSDGLSQEVPAARWWSAVAALIPIRSELIGSFLSHSCVCGQRKGGRGCWVLLRCECSRALYRNPVIGASLSVGRPWLCADGFGRAVNDMLEFYPCVARRAGGTACR